MTFILDEEIQLDTAVVNVAGSESPVIIDHCLSTK